MIDIREVMNGLAIKRFHTKRVLREQTVADHSARICAILCFMVDEPSGNLLRAAIFHDCSEMVTGDIPSPVKWANPALKVELNRVSTEWEVKQGLRVPLTELEARLLRFADLAEGCQYCIDELELGNRNLLRTLDRYLGAIGEMPVFEDDVTRYRQEQLLTNYEAYLNNASTR